MMVRQLNMADFEVFYFIRREALRQNPEAFYTRLSDFDARPIEDEKRRFAISVSKADRFILGAFNKQEKIVGMTGFAQLHQSGYRHTGVIWGVFVSAEARGQGFGRQLMEEAIALARTMPGIGLARLSVIRENQAAILLYKQCGFKPFKPQAADPLLSGLCGSELHMQLDLKK